MAEINVVPDWLPADTEVKSFEADWCVYFLAVTSSPET
jgi:hypothetical protein